MSAPMKKSTENTKLFNGLDFPSEVYKPHDDVTPEAVQLLRERVKAKIEGRKWKKVEGSARTNAC